VEIVVRSASQTCPGQKKAGQNRNDGDYHQSLDQDKSQPNSVIRVLAFKSEWRFNDQNIGRVERRRDRFRPRASFVSALSSIEANGDQIIPTFHPPSLFQEELLLASGSFQAILSLRHRAATIFFDLFGCCGKGTLVTGRKPPYAGLAGKNGLMGIVAQLQGSR
jgi:hypothetical protein